MTPTLDTDHLRFRAFDHGDVDDVRALQDRRLYEFLCVAPDAKVPDTDAEIRAKIDFFNAFAKRYPGLGFWHCSERATGKLVGQAFLVHVVKDSPIVQFCCVNVPSAWGRNHALDATECFTRYALDTLRLPYLTALTLEGNRSAVAVMQAVGYRSFVAPAARDLTVHYLTDAQWRAGRSSALPLSLKQRLRARRDAGVHRDDDDTPPADIHRVFAISPSATSAGSNEPVTSRSEPHGSAHTRIAAA